MADGDRIIDKKQSGKGTGSVEGLITIQVEKLGMTCQEDDF